jgi:hypothetical protein
MNTVIYFYNNDEYSRLCPGKKDFVTVKIDGQRVQKQKRLLLANLKELYVLFREKTKGLCPKKWLPDIFLVKCY